MAPLHPSTIWPGWAGSTPLPVSSQCWGPGDTDGDTSLGLCLRGQPLAASQLQLERSLEGLGAPSSTLHHTPIRSPVHQPECPLVSTKGLSFRHRESAGTILRDTTSISQLSEQWPCVPLSLSERPASASVSKRSSLSGGASLRTFVTAVSMSLAPTRWPAGTCFRYLGAGGASCWHPDLRFRSWSCNGGFLCGCIVSPTVSLGHPFSPDDVWGSLRDLQCRHRAGGHSSPFQPSFYFLVIKIVGFSSVMSLFKQVCCFCNCGCVVVVNFYCSEHFHRAFL